MNRLWLMCCLAGCTGMAPLASAFPGMGFSMGPRGAVLNANQGFLGVLLREVDAGTAENLKLPAERGALIQEVAPDTPAAAAGLEPNDVIIKFNRIQVESAMQLQRMVRETPSGRKVPLVVIRKGEEQAVKLTVGSAPALGMPGQFNFMDEEEREHPFKEYFDQRPRREFSPQDAFPSLTPGAKPRLGVMIQPLGKQLSQFFGLKADQVGVLVTSVNPGSAAEKSGVQAGDIILQINGTSVASPQEVIEQVSAAAAGKNNLLLLRDKKEMTVDVVLEDEAEEDIEDSI